MSNWQQIIVTPEAALQSVIEVIDQSALQIALVINPKECLIGTVTDGDIRRGLLAGFSMDSAIKNIMNDSPLFVAPDYDKNDLLATMKELKFQQVPVVLEDGKVVDLVTIDQLYDRIYSQEIERENWVVLMAGGLGTRLRPLTNKTPKPLIEISGKPLLENIVESFIAHGFKNFYLSVNYKADMIKDHFGDGEKWGINIRYLDEPEPLGTAGALSLIEETYNQPVVVMNGDVVSKVNIGEMLNYHISNNATATMGVREFEYQVPFGVVEIKNELISAINEKPIHQFLVNSGIYILQPDVMKNITPDAPLDMPSLFKSLMDEGSKCIAFPIHEYWIDVGRIEDVERANQGI